MSLARAARPPELLPRMPAADLRPRSVTELVDAAFTLYRRQPGQYVLAAALAYLPYLVPAVILGGGPASATGVVSALLLLPVSVVSNALMSAAVMQLGAGAYLGEATDFATVVRRSLRLAPRVVAAAVFNGVLVSLGLLALLVPAVWVYARNFAVVPAVVLEGRGVADAFARSGVLSAGRKRHVLNTLGLVWLVYWILLLGLGALSVLLTAVSPILTTLASTALTVVAYPVVGLTETVLYYDARIRGEGFDLERLEQALAAHVPPTPVVPTA